MFRKIIFLILLSVACSKREDNDTMPPSPKKKNTEQKKPTEQPSNKKPSSTETVNTDDDEHEDSGPQIYSMDHIHIASEKMLKRFDNFGLNTSSIIGIKSWKNDQFIFTKLTYKDSAGAESFLYNACHFHKKDIGCHIQIKGGPNEPNQ